VCLQLAEAVAQMEGGGPVGAQQQLLLPQAGLGAVPATHRRAVSATQKTRRRCACCLTVTDLVASPGEGISGVWHCAACTGADPADTVTAEVAVLYVTVVDVCCALEPVTLT
jgi:hypothetical protein